MLDYPAAKVMGPVVRYGDGRMLETDSVLLLVVAAHLKAPDSKTRVSIARIAKILGCGRRAAEKSIARLKKRGALVVESGGGGGNYSVYGLGPAVLHPKSPNAGPVSFPNAGPVSSPYGKTNDPEPRGSKSPNAGPYSSIEGSVEEGGGKKNPPQLPSATHPKTCAEIVDFIIAEQAADRVQPHSKFSKDGLARDVATRLAKYPNLGEIVMHLLVLAEDRELALEYPEDRLCGASRVKRAAKELAGAGGGDVASGGLPADFVFVDPLDEPIRRMVSE